MRAEAGSRWVRNHRQDTDDSGRFTRVFETARVVYYPDWLKKLQEQYAHAWELRHKTYVWTELNPQDQAALQQDFEAANAAVTRGMRLWDRQRYCLHDEMPRDVCTICGMTLSDYRQYLAAKK